MGFEQTTFGEYAKVQGGNAYKSKDFIEKSSNKVLKIKNVRFGTVNYDDSGYISDELAEATKAWQAKEGDILISMTGSGPNAPQSLVGRVARVWKDEPAAWINQRVGRIQLKDEGMIHPDFLFYLLSLPQSQEFLVSNSSGSANQANISGKIIELLPCPKVTFNQSKSIADIARSLDEKIILNNQTNQTLEQMAQALFKSWFVDFDPVFDNLLASADFKLENLETSLPDELQQKAQRRLAALNSLENAAECKASLIALAHELQALSAIKEATKEATQSAVQAAETPVKANLNANPNILAQHANTHAYFPNEFEHNEQLGWIPKGWSAFSAEDEFVVKGGSTPSTKNPDFWEGGDIHWTSPKDLSGNTTKIMLDTSRKITSAGLKKITSGLLPIDTVLMSSRAPVGYLALAKVPVAINQGYIAITDAKTLSSEYTIQWLNSVMDEIKGISGGTTFAEISKKTFKSIQLVIPSKKAVEAYTEITKMYYERITACVQEINTLTETRDYLLPKLISGELQIPDVATMKK